MRVKVFFSSLLLLMLNVALLHAQDGIGQPCDATDPDVNCPTPLDTWVVLLAVVAVIFAAWHLRNKQKKASSFH